MLLVVVLPSGKEKGTSLRKGTVTSVDKPSAWVGRTGHTVSTKTMAQIAQIILCFMLLKGRVLLP